MFNLVYLAFSPGGLKLFVHQEENCFTTKSRHFFYYFVLLPSLPFIGNFCEEKKLLKNALSTTTIPDDSCERANGGHEEMFVDKIETKCLMRGMFLWIKGAFEGRKGKFCGHENLFLGVN